MSTDTAPWHTIPQLITDGCERFADLDAMVDGDERWNFREYGERARAAGRAFMASAMDQGDVYAIWAPNVCEWAVAALGGYLSASVLVPINTRFKGREAAFVLRRSQAHHAARGFVGRVRVFTRHGLKVGTAFEFFHQ